MTPTPAPTGKPAPTASPTATPLATPTPFNLGCSNQYFNQKGETTSFEIPAGLIGSLSRGLDYAATCTRCHGQLGTNWSFTNIKAAVTGPKMRLQYSDQSFADITAWLNRSLAPSTCPGTPTPTPTPLTDVGKGKLFFESTCQFCHTATELRGDLGTTLSGATQKVRSAIAGVGQMRSLIVTDEQIRVLFLYLRSLP